MKSFNILLIKETRANEARVGLVPKDVAQLIQFGHQVRVESQAGFLAGFTDSDYQAVGATICINDGSLVGYQKLFADIDLIIRVKRANHIREHLECTAINPNTIMVGALDPLEKNSNHIKNYHDARVIAYSIDQLDLPSNDPMNLLAIMSKVSGRLALLDAINKFHAIAKNLVIIGCGTVGLAALEEAIKLGLSVKVFANNDDQFEKIVQYGGTPIFLDRNAEISLQQAIIKAALLDSDIVITSARKARQVAPILIPMETLNQLKSGTVIVDMALSEGGNVEGSEHDITHILGNGVLVTNVSGYPKSLPRETSILWSNINLKVIQCLTEDINHQILCNAKC